MTPFERAALARVRAADAAHDLKMSIVCARAGISLNKMRKMSMREKSNLFAKYGDAAVGAA